MTVPLGDFTGEQMRVLADLSLAFSDGSIRITPDQDLVFRWVPVDAVERLYEQLAAAGLSLPDAGTIADVTSCPGAESCRLAVTQSRGLGKLLGDHLRERPDLVEPRPTCTSRSAAARTAAASITSPASASRAASARSRDARCRSTS